MQPTKRARLDNHDWSTSDPANDINDVMMSDVDTPYVLAYDQLFPVLRCENLVPLPVMVPSKSPDNTSYPLQYSGLQPSVNLDLSGDEQNFEHTGAKVTVQNPSCIEIDVPYSVNTTSPIDDAEISLKTNIIECDRLSQDTAAQLDKQAVVMQLAEKKAAAPGQNDKDISQSTQTSRYTPTIYTLESAFAADPAGLAGSLVSLPACWTSVNELVKVADQLRPERPPEDFTKEEISNVEGAVTYLHSSRCLLEASYLYAMLLAWRYSRNLQDSWRSFTFVLDYAKVASTNAHLSIVSHLLVTMLERKSESTSCFAKLKEFHCHYHLARIESYEVTAHESQEFTQSIAGHIDRFQSISHSVNLRAMLPKNHKELDFETAAMKLRLELHGTASLFNFMFDGNIWEVKEIARRMIETLNESCRGYFAKIGDSEAREIQCLRACLRWCAAELRMIDALSESWRVGLLAAKIKDDHGEMVMLIGYVTSVFHQLWGRLLNAEQDASTTQDKQHLKWAYILDGLRPDVTLLKVVCYSPSRYPVYREKFVDSRKRLKSADALHVAMIECLEKIQELPDEQLGQMYMEGVLIDENFIKDVSIPKERKARNAVLSFMRPWALDRIRKTLMVVIPESGVGEEWSESNNSSSQNIALRETLAPSLRSESLRWMKQRRRRSMASFSSRRVSGHQSRTDSDVAMSLVSDQMNALLISEK
jgi:hypothetical protein